MAGFVTYFDEIKPSPDAGQPRYVIGGLVVPIEAITDLEARCNELAEKVFGTRKLEPKTEFHASFIYSGKGAFKGKPISERLDILAALARIISEAEGTQRVYAAIDSSKTYAGTDNARMAFAYFCERVQMAVGRGNSTLMIGDHDDQGARQMIREFSAYRLAGETPWDYGIKIPSIVDAVHFVQSHHSRLIQLADAYLFLMAHNWGHRGGWPATELSKQLAGIDLYANRYKEWPKE